MTTKKKKSQLFFFSLSGVALNPLCSGRSHTDPPMCFKLPLGCLDCLMQCTCDVSSCYAVNNDRETSSRAQYGSVFCAILIWVEGASTGKETAPPSLPHPPLRHCWQTVPTSSCKVTSPKDSLFPPNQLLYCLHINTV